MISPSDRWAPCSTDRERRAAMLRDERERRQRVARPEPAPAPSWWEPLVVLSLCGALGWLSWFVAFGGRR